MIEPLTEEKLREYGFSEDDILRLTTWEAHGCFCINNKGKFWATNIEKEIHSGIDAENIIRQRQIIPYIKMTEFETFERLFDYATHMDPNSIEKPINQGHKMAIKNLYAYEFHFWLRNYKFAPYGIDYKQYYTKDNWIEFLKHKKRRADEIKSKLIAEKASWQISNDVSEKTQYEEPENNFLLSTIEDWLYPFKEQNAISEKDYKALLSTLENYFIDGKFPKRTNKIKVGKVNKKAFGWALNQIYRSQKSDTLSYEFLLFAKQNISLYDKMKFDRADYQKSTFYKYFTTETK